MDPWVVELEDQVAMNHQGDYPEGHPQEAHLVVHLVALLEMEVMTEMMILWEREDHHMEVGYRMLDTELPLSLLILDLGD